MRLFVGLGFWCQCHDFDLVISIFLRHTISLSYFSPDTHRSPCIFHRIERPSDNAGLLWISFWIVVDWCFDPQLLCMLKTWRPNAEVAPVAPVCMRACEWLNKKCILKSCVEQLRLKVQTNCILTILPITQQIIDFHILLPECPLSVHPEISSSAFLFSWQLRRHYPAHRPQEELTALSHKPIQSGLSRVVSELSLWYTLSYSCPSFSLLAQISRALIQTIYHLICFYFERYLAFPPSPSSSPPPFGCKIYRLFSRIMKAAVEIINESFDSSFAANSGGSSSYSAWRPIQWTTPLEKSAYLSETLMCLYSKSTRLNRKTHGVSVSP